jgi:hypothetical protein
MRASLLQITAPPVHEDLVVARRKGQSDFVFGNGDDAEGSKGNVMPQGQLGDGLLCLFGVPLFLTRIEAFLLLPKELPSSDASES